MRREFEDSVVVVTGGAQGIGYAISKAYLDEGAYVCILDIDKEALKELEEIDFKDYGNRVMYIECDLAKEEDIKRSCREIIERFDKVDILINNAGIGSTKSIFERDTSEWDRVIDINLRAPYLMTKYLAQHMKEGGSIINIASTRAFMSEPNTEPYSASKGGLVALTHSLAISLSPYKIRVNCISPGWIETSNYKKRSKRMEPQLREIDHLQHPAGRVGVPEDIAYACLFLTSKKAGFITGANLTVDGGMTIKMIYEE